MSAAVHERGRLMAAEMAEQPRVLGELAARRHDIVATVRSMFRSTPSGTVFAARGSSANAALHGRLLAQIATGKPAMISSLSLRSAYGVDLDHRGWLGVSISQSGRTPEIVDAAVAQRRCGATTIAVTNDVTSPLAEAADRCVALDAGPELAVPATKTFTAQVAALAAVASAFGGRDDPTWDQLAGAVHACLDDAVPVERIAGELLHATTLITAGRGFGFPAAREGALKIKEITGITAEAYTHLDLLHGPIAVAGAMVPAIVVALRGPTEADSRRLIDELTARRCRPWIVGDVDGADVPIGRDLSEPLAAIAVAVRMQQIALRLALDRDLDPDAPHGLQKVTLT